MNRLLKNTCFILMVSFFTFCTSTIKEASVINLIPLRNGVVYRYVNQQNKIIIKLQFKEASIFRNGFAMVQVFGSKPTWGFIGEDGKYLIKPIYKEATIFSEDFAWVVSENGAPKAINVKGDSIFSLKAAKSVRIFKNGLAAFSICIDSLNVKWGFVDKKGTIKIEPQFSSTNNFSDGKCAVANAAGEWGYIDIEGKLIVNYQYTNAKNFVNGKAIVLLGKEWGVIDRIGKFSINPQFSEMISDKNQYLIKQNNKWGWCDKNGKISIQPQFIQAYPFKDSELALVKSGDKFGYINKNGKMVIAPQFENALPFNGIIAWVVNNLKGGFVDNHGKYIIQPQYDAISEDFKAFLLDESSSFESINSDYFDLDNLINRLKKEIKDNSVEGLNYNTPLSVIYTKYKKSEYDFNKSNSEHQIVFGERISNDITLDFFILGNPWTQIDNGRSGFSFNLKPNYKHAGFSYRINLRSNGIGKENMILKVLKTALSGYTKDEKHSNENVINLQNKTNLIVCLKQNKAVIVAIYPKTKENLMMIDSNYNYGITTDAISVESDTVPSN